MGLGVTERFSAWFDRMCEYGFTEVDYKKCFPNLESGCNGGQNRVDYLISVDMAKQICMIQRSPESSRLQSYSCTEKGQRISITDGSAVALPPTCHHCRHTTQECARR